MEQSGSLFGRGVCSRIPCAAFGARHLDFLREAEAINGAST